MSELILHKSDKSQSPSLGPKEARQARECALRALFQLDIVAGEPERALQYACSEEVAGQLAQEAIDYAACLVDGVRAASDDIDNTISRISKDWSLDRMALTDRNIMRIAVFEMTFVKGMSLAVAINEAVELGKAFGSEDSPRFINGIIGKLAEEIKSS